jgi:hypothetical protein
MSGLFVSHAGSRLTSPLQKRIVGSRPNEYLPLKIRSLLMNCKTQKGVGNV